jgi:hypothetical protein
VLVFPVVPEDIERRHITCADIIVIEEHYSTTLAVLEFRDEVCPVFQLDKHAFTSVC